MILLWFDHPLANLVIIYIIEYFILYLYWCVWLLLLLFLSVFCGIFFFAFISVIRWDFGWFKPSIWHHHHQHHHQYRPIFSHSQIFPIIFLCMLFLWLGCCGGFFFFVLSSVSCAQFGVCLRAVHCTHLSCIGFCNGLSSSWLCQSITKIMTSVSLSAIINRIWHKRIQIALSMDINEGIRYTHYTHPPRPSHNLSCPVIAHQNMQTVIHWPNKTVCIIICLWFDVRGLYRTCFRCSIFTSHHIIYFAFFLNANMRMIASSVFNWCMEWFDCGHFYGCI